MQVTIELPEELAKQLAAERDHLVEIIKRGLRSRSSGQPSGVTEVFDFLAYHPSPAEILAFRPAEGSTERLRGLLDKNAEGSLSTAEEAELDTLQCSTICSLSSRSRPGNKPQTNS